MGVSVDVRDFDVVVDELVFDTGDGGVIKVRDDVGQDEEVHIPVASDVASGHVRHLHVEGLPGPHSGATGVGVVVRLGEWIDAVEVHAVFDLRGGNATYVIGKRPHRKVAGVDVLLVSVMRPKAHTPRIPRIALRNQDGRGGVVHAWCGLDDLVGIGQGVVDRQGLLDLHVNGRTVVHVSAGVAGKQEVPRLLGEGAGGGGVHEVRDVHGAGQIFGHLNVVFTCGQHRPVAGIFRPSIGVKGVVAVVVQRPKPIDELRVSPIVGSVEPRAVLDVDEVAGRDRMVVEELLDGGGDVSC